MPGISVTSMIVLVAGVPSVERHTRTMSLDGQFTNIEPSLNEKALSAKPSALIFGRGRAKELLHVRDDLRKRTR